jgi:hypothetical protein
MAFEDRSGHFPGCDPMSAVGLNGHRLAAAPCLGADIGARVEWHGAPRVWDSWLEFPSSASHGEPLRTAAHLALCGTEVEVVDAVAGQILSGG